MEIRTAGAEDIEMLIQLRLEYIRAVETDPIDERAFIVPLRDYFQKNLNRGLFAFLADLDGVTAATVFLILTDWPPSPALPEGRLARVANVLTRSPYRRRGLATALMLHLIGEARGHKASRIDLTTTEAGLELYHGLGFVQSIDPAQMHLYL